ncbi:MAG TPA: Yip1 family protein [Candidatus Omnitrophota bacterium]|nr:Yip1 family protein [Candidatus Omnitrophota bacterium]
MNIVLIFERARELLFYPARAWEKIKGEKPGRDLIVYPLVLALVQPVAIMIGYWLIGLWIGSNGYVRMSFLNSFYSALVAYFLSLLGVAVMAFLIMVLANYFQVESDMPSAAKLAVYASTAPLLCGIFQLIPGIRILMILGLYGAYQLYTGIPKLLKAAHDKEPPFTFTSIIAGIILMLLINFLISQYIFGILYSDILTY